MRTLFFLTVFVGWFNTSDCGAQEFSRYLPVRPLAEITEPTAQGMMDGQAFASRQEKPIMWIFTGALMGAINGVLANVDETDVDPAAHGLLTAAIGSGAYAIVAVASKHSLRPDVSAALDATPPDYAAAFRAQHSESLRSRQLVGALVVGLMAGAADMLIVNARQSQR